jgi:hypothetical protein
MPSTGGWSMEVHRRIEDPPVWILRWPLARGVIYTHLREEDPADHAAVVAQSVEIVDNGAGIPPTLLLESPLKRLVLQQPGYHEYVLLNDRQTDTSIQVRRPSTLAPDQLRVLERRANDLHPIILRGATHGFEVVVSSSTWTVESTTALARALRVFPEAA